METCKQLIWARYSKNLPSMHAAKIRSSLSQGKTPEKQIWLQKSIFGVLKSNQTHLVSMPKLSQRQSSMSQPLTNLHVLDLHSNRNQGIKRNSKILRCQFHYSTTRLHVWWQLHLSPPPRRGTRQRRHQEFHKMLTGNWGNYVHLTVGPTLVWQANLHTLFQLKMMRKHNQR